MIPKEIVKIVNDNADGTEKFMVTETLNIHTSKKDIYIKKAGKIAAVIFLTKKSLDIAKNNNVPNHYPDSDQHRFDIHPNQAIQILTWAISHDLSVDSELPMTIQPKK